MDKKEKIELGNELMNSMKKHFRECDSFENEIEFDTGNIKYATYIEIKKNTKPKAYRIIIVITEEALETYQDNKDQAKNKFQEFIKSKVDNFDTRSDSNYENTPPEKWYVRSNLLK